MIRFMTKRPDRPEPHKDPQSLLGLSLKYIAKEACVASPYPTCKHALDVGSFPLASWQSQEVP